MKQRVGDMQLGVVEVVWDQQPGGGGEAVRPCRAQLPGVYLTVCFHHFSVRRERDHTAAESPGNQ